MRKNFRAIFRFVMVNATSLKRSRSLINLGMFVIGTRCAHSECCSSSWNRQRICVVMRERRHVQALKERSHGNEAEQSKIHRTQSCAARTDRIRRGTLGCTKKSAVSFRDGWDVGSVGREFGHPPADRRPQGARY